MINHNISLRQYYSILSIEKSQQAMKEEIKAAVLPILSGAGEFTYPRAELHNSVSSVKVLNYCKLHSLKGKSSKENKANVKPL
jgi:hypothetical protein